MSAGYLGGALLSYSFRWITKLVEFTARLVSEFTARLVSEFTARLVATF